MRLLQITTIISAVLVDVAYVYNATNLSIGVLRNHPVARSIGNNLYQQQAHFTQDTRGDTLRHSNTYKDYGYLNTGNVPNYSANVHQLTLNHNNLNAFGNLPSGPNNVVGTSNKYQINGANNVKNGYLDYTQPWSPKANLNNGLINILTPPNVQNYQYNNWKPVNNVQLTTNGYQQSSLPINQDLNTGQSNQYTINQNQVNNVPADLHNNINYNSGFSNTLISTAHNGVYNNGLKTSQVKHEDPLNNRFKKLALTAFNKYYDQSGRHNTDLNNGYTEDIHSNFAFNSALSQSSPTVPTNYNIKEDTIYTQRLPSISDSTNNHFAHSSLNVQQSQSTNYFDSLLSPITPIIHKHVYFHVPPPDIEEPGKLVAQPARQKKDYKILFIKVPSQTSRLNLARLQQQMEQAAALQEKTLIYVLVKKQEKPESILIYPPKQSDHQVFFVKYNGDPFDIASEVNDEINATGSIKSIVPSAPGLVKGQS